MKENIKAPHLNTLIKLHNSEEKSNMVSKLVMLKESKNSPPHEAEGEILNAKEWQEKYDIIPGTVNGYFFAHVNFKPVNRDRFIEILNDTHRFWDDDKKIGIDRRRAIKSGLMDPIKKEGYILIRYDGWSLSCKKESLREAYHLYPDSWKKIYKLADGQ